MRYRWKLLGWAIMFGTIAAAGEQGPDLTPKMKFRRETVELPFMARHNDQLVVAAKLGPNEGEWLVDTNFFISVANHLPAKARWFQRTPFTWTVQYGAEQKKLPVVRYKKLSIGEGAVTAAGFAVAPSLAEQSPMKEDGAPDLAGIIGLDVLRAAHATVDYGTRNLTLRMRPAKAEPVTDAIARLPLLEGTAKQIAVAGRIGDREFTLLVDTGSEYTIVSREIAESDPSARRESSVSQWTYAGTVEVDRVAVDGFQLGEHRFGTRVLLVSDDFSRLGLKAGGLPVVGVLGADILAGQRACIDLNEGILYLRENTR